MDWDKAKKIVIIMLLILNAGLFGLNYTKSQKYVLSQEKEKAIFQVLSENGIGVYTKIIEKFPPMKQLSVKISPLETDVLQNMFFDENEEPSITVEFNKTILKTSSKTLTIENNDIIFECAEGTGVIPKFSKESAKTEANKFLKKLNAVFSDSKLDHIKEKNGEYIFEYYENYNGYKIFSSNSKITVNEKGIVKFTASYYEAEMFVGEKMEISSPDEALFTFMKEIKKQDRRNGIFIEKMEIGYDFQERSEIAEGSKLKLVPSYHIYISSNEKPYVINALTNKLVN